MRAESVLLPAKAAWRRYTHRCHCHMLCNHCLCRVPTIPYFLHGEIAWLRWSLITGIRLYISDLRSAVKYSDVPAFRLMARISLSLSLSLSLVMRLFCAVDRTLNSNNYLSLSPCVSLSQTLSVCLSPLSLYYVYKCSFMFHINDALYIFYVHQ